MTEFGLSFTGMAPDYLPRISSEKCGYPFTYVGVLDHEWAENMKDLSTPCERWGCFQVNYSAAVCAANIGKQGAPSFSTLIFHHFSMTKK